MRPKNEIDKTKYCRWCNTTKPLPEFSQSNRNKSGYCNRCKKCVAAYGRQHYQKNREQIDKKHEAYRKLNWERIKQASYEYERKHPLKREARKAVNNAINWGRFEKESCQACGNPRSDFHHTNGYDKENWFVGIWLCRKHHLELHRKLRWQTINSEGATT